MRYALRSLVKAPGFSVAVILTLALGIDAARRFMSMVKVAGAAVLSPAGAG